MGTRHIENHTRNAIFVGGKLIPPGSGRDIDEALLPPERRGAPEQDGAPAEPTMAELVQALQARSVKDITAELPALKQEALDMLREAEGASATPRTSLLAALDAERLRRANDQLQADADAAYQKQLDALTPEQLAAIGEGAAVGKAGAGEAPQA
jgi:hypothetical protein